MSNWLFFILTRLAGLIRRSEPQAGHYHDVAAPSRYHSQLRLFRRDIRLGTARDPRRRQLRSPSPTDVRRRLPGSDRAMQSLEPRPPRAHPRTS
jgi:hypothetical protein